MRNNIYSETLYAERRTYAYKLWNTVVCNLIYLGYNITYVFNKIMFALKKQVTKVMFSSSLKVKIL